MLTFKGHNVDGMPGFRVFAGARCLGAIFNPGPGGPGPNWEGVAPDGTRFGATSQPKLAQRLQIHAARNRQGASA